MTQNNEIKQSDYEKKHGLVARAELKDHILGMFDRLDDYQFHNIYAILWSMSGSKTAWETAEYWRKVAAAKGVQ